MSGDAPIIEPRVLPLLRCPVTGQGLVEHEIDGRRVLMSKDRRIVYEIRDGLPILLPPDRPGASVIVRQDP